MGSHLGAVFSSPHQIIYRFMCKGQPHTHVQDGMMILMVNEDKGHSNGTFSFIKDAASIKQ